LTPKASLSDRCGALHVGDLLLAVNGVSVVQLDLDAVTDLIRGDPTVGTWTKSEIPSVLSLNVLKLKNVPFTIKGVSGK
jgi:hypothetical protein